MAVPVDNLTETGHVIAWMGPEGIRLHWIVGRLSKALGRWEDYDEALVRTWAEIEAPDDALIVDENDLPTKPARSTAIIRDGRVVAAAAWRVSQWQAKVNAALDKADKLGGPRAMREALSATAPRLAHIERWATELRALTWDGEGDEPPIPELGPFVPSDVHNFPANLAEPLSDWGAVGEGAEPEQLVGGLVDALGTGRDSAEAAIRSLSPSDRERLFPILNEELGRLKNEEALLGKTIPRRAAVESLLGILARVGEA